MSFLKEGKKLSYNEVIEMHQSLIKQDILPQLETEEINSFFMRVMKFIEEKLNLHLIAAGYKANNTQQVFENAARLRLTTDTSVWQQALEFQQKIESKENTDEDKDSLIKFMSGGFLEALRHLGHHVEVTRIE